MLKEPYASPGSFDGMSVPAGRNTRHRWLARPYQTGTCTPQEAPSFAWRTNIKLRGYASLCPAKSAGAMGCVAFEHFIQFSYLQSSNPYLARISSILPLARNSFTPSVNNSAYFLPVLSL